MTWCRVWAAYIAAHVGKSLLWTGSDLLPLYLFVSVYALDPMTAGGLLLPGLTRSPARGFPQA